LSAALEVPVKSIGKPQLEQQLGGVRFLLEAALECIARSSVTAGQEVRLDDDGQSFRIIRRKLTSAIKVGGCCFIVSAFIGAKAEVELGNGIVRNAFLQIPEQSF